MRRTLLATVAVLLFALPAFAKFGVRPGWTRAYVNSGSRPQVESVVAATNSELLWIYSNRALVYTSNLTALQTKAIEMGTTASQAKDLSNVFSVNGITVDPERDVKAPDDFREYSSKLGLYVLQFAGPYDPAMAVELAALGVKVVAAGAQSTSNNAAIVQASLSDVRKTDALPWLAYRDLLHPRFKGSYREVDPERYYAASFVVAATAPDASRIAQQLALPSYAADRDRFNFLGRDVTALFEHPLVQSVRVSSSAVDLLGVLPAQGPPGSSIILNVSNSLQVDEVRFNGVLTDFVRVDYERIRATVPQLPNGPADITVFRKDGWRQILPSRANYGFRVADRLGDATFARGDLVVMLLPDVIVSVPATPVVSWYTPQGELRRTLGATSFDGQLFFGAQGFLNATRWSGDAERFDAFFVSTGKGPEILREASVVTMGSDGSSFIVVNDELRRHAPNGELKQKAALSHTWSIDLATDQCTLVLAGIRGLELFDGCRMQSLGVLRTGDWRSARFLPDGSILAGNEDGTLLRITTSGAILYNAKIGRSPALAIAPDATFVWVAFEGRLARFDLAQQTLTMAPLTTPGMRVLSFTVYGEWTAGRGEAAYDDELVIDEVQGFDHAAGSPVTISGRGWLPGAEVTIGGVVVPNASIGSTRITFPMPGAPKSSREVMVRNPNGQRATMNVPPKAKSKRRAV